MSASPTLSAERRIPRESIGDLVTDWTADDDLVAAVARDGRPRVAIHRPDRPMVVLGRGSRPEVELDVEACLADGAPLRRRRGGGCAVVLDPGNVVVSAALGAEGIGGSRRWFDRFTRWILDGLGTVGIEGIRTAGVSDLVLGSRKVGGSAIWRSKGLVYFSTTLLAEAPLDLMQRWLAHPPREPGYRRGRSHRDFVDDLSDSLDPSDPAADLEARLDDVLGSEGLITLLPDRTPGRRTRTPAP